MTIAGLLLIAGAQVTFANANALCQDSALRRSAAQLVDAWSKNYPFSRVLIGDDGRLGDVYDPKITLIGDDFVVCMGRYLLNKFSANAPPYTVSINKLKFRVTAQAAGYRVELEDLPVSLAGTNVTSHDLIARFTINDRPYTEILEENRRRLVNRGRPAAAGE